MRVNQVAAEFRKVSNKQMAETTKRTIRENVAINAQLTKMSDKTLEMIQVCDSEIKDKIVTSCSLFPLVIASGPDNYTCTDFPLIKEYFQFYFPSLLC